MPKNVLFPTELVRLGVLRTVLMVCADASAETATEFVARSETEFEGEGITGKKSVYLSDGYRRSNKESARLKISRAEERSLCTKGYCTDAVRPVGAAGRLTEAVPY
jgi:hypothetical protein